MDDLKTSEYLRHLLQSNETAFRSKTNQGFHSPYSNLPPTLQPEKEWLPLPRQLATEIFDRDLSPLMQSFSGGPFSNKELATTQPGGREWYPQPPSQIRTDPNVAVTTEHIRPVDTALIPSKRPAVSSSTNSSKPLKFKMYTPPCEYPPTSRRKPLKRMRGASPLQPNKIRGDPEFHKNTEHIFLLVIQASPSTLFFPKNDEVTPFPLFRSLVGMENQTLL